ncbi:MAG: isochorismatase family cysteine hydrolase [Oscillospiraceae bacterium]|nr:isochorismatase family cysteine hydrolase [Oscillospiraceae bacterium]
MKKVLLVIDMQNDYLDDGRKKQFTYDTPGIVTAVNKIIEERRNQCDIVYIRHIIQNIWTNRVLFGYSIAGTYGAQLYKKLEKVSENSFDKLLPDAFSSKQFRKFIQDNGYDTAEICGIDECGCVCATAWGALKHGLKTEIIKSGVATKFPESKINKVHKMLTKAGAVYK